MLTIRNVGKTFHKGTVNEKVALRDINITFETGDYVTVIGGNGAGKSTLLNLIAGTYPADSGSIELDGVELTRLPEHRRASMLGRVFQDPMMGTAAGMGIEENLAMAYRRGSRRGLRWGISAAERARYREALGTLDLGLEGRLNTKVGLLSGGQRQALTLLMATLFFCSSSEACARSCFCWTSIPPRSIRARRRRCSPCPTSSSRRTGSPR